MSGYVIWWSLFCSQAILPTGVLAAAVKLRKAVKKYTKLSIPFAALMSIAMASLGLLLQAGNSYPVSTPWPGLNIGISSAVHNSLPRAAVKTVSTMQSSGSSAVPKQLAGTMADYLPSLTPGMLVSVPRQAEGLAETDGLPFKVSQASALSPQHNRFPAILLAALDWVPCMIPGLPGAALAVPSIQPAAPASAHTSSYSSSSDIHEWSEQIPLQLISGPDVIKTSTEPYGWQPTALARLVPGMQSVLLQVRNLSLDLSGSIAMSSALSWMPNWPAVVPGGADTFYTMKRHLLAGSSKPD